MKYQDDGQKKFGKLTRIGPWFRCKKYHAVFKCKCGRITVTSRFSIQQGTTTCGCLQREAMSRASKTHGVSASHRAEYHAWFHMVRRCHNPKDESFRHYGGRGITVCRRWRSSPANFLSDMGPRPSRLHSIHRINNSKGYYKKNCKWAISEEQNNERRNNRRLTIRGRTRTVSQWSRHPKCQVSVITVFKRLDKGWPSERAVFAPLNTKTKDVT